MPVKRLLVVVSALIAVAVVGVGIANESAPVAPVIQDSVWNQLVQRAQKCKPNSSALLTVTMDQVAERGVLTIDAKSTDRQQSLSVYPYYGEMPAEWGTGAYYTAPNGSGISLSTRIGNDNNTIDYSADPIESQRRTAVVQRNFKEILDTLGCAAS